MPGTTLRPPNPTHRLPRPASVPGPLWALVRGLSSLAVLIVIAIGVPASLMRHVGRPWPLHVPPLAELRRRLETGEVRGMVVVALAVLVWLTWARLMVAVLVEIIARAVHRARHREPSAVAALASGLVTGVSLLGLVLPGRPGAFRADTGPALVVAPDTGSGAVAPAGSAVPTFVVRHDPAVLDGWRSVPFLAAGVVGVVEAARRRHLRAAPAGSVVRPLPEALARLESGVRAVAAPPVRARLSTLASDWASAVAAAAPVVPVAALVGADVDDLTVLFDGPAPVPPRGWTSAGVDRWRRRHGGVDGSPGTEAGPVALLPVGRCAGADLYLDVAATGPLLVEAPPAEAERIERAVTAAVEWSAFGWPAAVPALADDGRGAMARLVAVGARWRLEPLGIVVEPFGLAQTDLDQVRALVAEVIDPAPVPATPSVPRDPAALATRRVARRDDGAWSFLVRVLGPPDIIGADGRAVDFERTKAQELVVWLALHRHHPGRDAARTALWDQDVRDSTFANVVSEARRALNRHQVPGDGGEWLGRATGELLPLHAEVWTDVERFEALLDRARRSADGPEATEALDAALALVRGVPFAGGAHAWADADGTSSNLTLMVVGAAAERAEIALRADDREAALAATTVGLALVPGHEELVGLRLRAHAGHGDLSGVRHEWDAYQRTLQTDRWQSAPSPRLVALRDELLAPVTIGAR